MVTRKQNMVTCYHKRIFRKRYFYSSLLSAYLMFSSLIPVKASGIGESKIITGTQQLMADITTWLMVLAPIVAGLLIIYFCIRRSAADEMDTKKWNGRIIVAVVSCIGAILSSATLNLIIGYYQ